MIIPADERRLLASLPGDREANERAWRYGCLYGRMQAMQAANRAVHDLPSLFGQAEVKTDELEKAVAELQRVEIETWTFYTWEDDIFCDPEHAIDRYEMGPGEILILEEVEARVVGVRRWQVREDGGLIKLPDEEST